MIAKILRAKNLTTAYRRVVGNKGSAGIDGMGITELKKYIDAHRTYVATIILKGKYQPSAIKGVEIPKRNDERFIPTKADECLGDIQMSEPKRVGCRLLGVPTVVDRWLQQSVSQQLMTRFELEFEPHSYGFRPKKNLQQAVLQSLAYINDGYQDIVDIELKGFFDEVAHYKILQLIYDKVKCQTTLRLIRKWLRAPILVGGKLIKRRKGVPQDE